MNATLTSRTVAWLAASIITFCLFQSVALLGHPVGARAPAQALALAAGPAKGPVCAAAAATRAGARSKPARC